ncbi:prostatic acid phosphatase-like [Mercenaria mercenaria]|uniref:prostatic acid phosphatase-like n=1 Tax=Mercenaria mercenaria TaxID=6596 RepID=UPI00234E7BBB|nr:prostatic acid phosphatase-like [Mercenaria mercenaria]
MKLIIFISILTVTSGDIGFFDEDNPEFSDPPETVPTLRLVQVLYRHGDRSPTHNYTNDIYQESDWPQGYGQLSTEGMQQEFELGTFLRQEYVSTQFLSSEYTRSEVYVRSTSFDRALMSAYSVLAGLFPPIQEDRLWNEEITWQPIPVHTVPLEEDYLLIPDHPCPVYEAAKNKTNENNPIIQQTMEEFSDFYSTVSLYSGEPNTWDGIGHVLDPIFCQESSEYVLPDWVTNEVFYQIVQLRDIYTSVASSPRDFAYLKGGVLVGEMLDHMINKSKQDISTPQKLFMYSAHDSTVQFFLTTLGIFNDKQPPYTACVIVELHELQPGDFAVQFLYKNETGNDTDPYILTLPDCDDLCPLDKFAQLMRPSVPDDIRKACGVKSTSNTQSGSSEGPSEPSGPEVSAVSGSPEVSTITVIVLLCLIVLMVIIVAVLCCVKRDRLANTHDYMPVPLEMS